MTGELGTRGDCFTAALVTAKELADQGVDRVLVCHGKPLGRGGDALGLRFWHAWVEAKIDGKWEVFDFSAGARWHLPRFRYYVLGSIAQDGYKVRRYSLVAAAHLVRTTGHAGPWEDPDPSSP